MSLAAKSAIMSIFSLYGLNFYEEANENLDRYLKTYPSDKNVMYAHYLQAIISFEQISDEKKELKEEIERLGGKVVITARVVIIILIFV